MYAISFVNLGSLEGNFFTTDTLRKGLKRKEDDSTQVVNTETADNEMEGAVEMARGEDGTNAANDPTSLGDGKEKDGSTPETTTVEDGELVAGLLFNIMITVFIRAKSSLVTPAEVCNTVW